MLDIVILAAGKGTRMASSLPKVLHPIAGVPMLEHVIRATSIFDSANTSIVIGHGAEQVKTALTHREGGLNWALQSEQLGTGHAVKMAVDYLDDDNIALILLGDVPLIKSSTLTELVDKAGKTDFALLTVTVDNPAGYGRVVRDELGHAVAIVEEKDASEQQRLITEVNTGVMAIRGKRLKHWLSELKSDNSQAEYYLTDVLAMAVADGVQVATTEAESEYEVMGVNNRVQQQILERQYQQAYAQTLLQSGVHLFDAQRIDVRGELTTGQDCSIDVGCVFKGIVELGDNVIIEANCVLENTVIGSGTHVKAHSIIEDSILDGNNDIGPFARLRPGTKLANRAKVGNFVETKKAIIGEGSKVNHLSYIGDAELGQGVNVGAGTITCNYDGINKHKTVIADNSFIGSNSTLVAPVEIEQSAFVGAGSVVTKKVPENSLSVARAKQIIKEGWIAPNKR